MYPSSKYLGPNAPLWHLYLLIDPSTGPTNHPRGTIFYVGYRKPDQSRGMADLRAWQSIPKREAEAREHAKKLIRSGYEPLVEVIGDHRISDDLPEDTITIAVAAVVASLTPRPLNVRAESIRVDGDVIERIVNSRRVSIPESGVFMRADHRRALPNWVAGEDAADPLRGELWSKTVPPALVRALEAGPIPFLVYHNRTTSVHVFPPGTIINVDLITGITEDRGKVLLEFGGWEAELAAAREHFLYNTVDMDDPRIVRASGY